MYKQWRFEYQLEPLFRLNKLYCNREVTSNKSATTPTQDRCVQYDQTNREMTKSEQLANRLREVIFNGTWIANTNFKDQLENLDWKIGIKKVQSLNTISVLAQHIHYYVDGIKSVLIDGKLEISDKYSFDFPPIESQTEWEEFQNKFWSDTEKLAESIEKMSDEQLDEKFVDEKYGSYLRNIDGMIEHSYYHLGQIVLINKLVTE